MKELFKIATVLLACIMLIGSVQTACAEEWTPEMIEKLKMLAKRGDRSMQTTLAYHYVKGEGDPQDYAKARYWYEQAARQGHALAQQALGFMYVRGQSVRQDYARARYWFEKAARQGNTAAQGALGVMYQNGHGVRQNKSIAKEWFGKACDGGSQLGCDSYRRLNEAGF